MSLNPECAEQMLHEGVCAVLEPFLRIQVAVVATGADGDEGEESSSPLTELKSNCAQCMIHVLQPLVSPLVDSLEET